MTRPCCGRDVDEDGNCDRHPALTPWRRVWFEVRLRAFEPESEDPNALKVGTVRTIEQVVVDAGAIPVPEELLREEFEDALTRLTELVAMNAGKGKGRD